jgi:membrane protein insertase Oxa1/YidC/SpoIIIJ
VGEVTGLNVLPLIMMAMWIVTQVVMQKNMPRPSDPQQAQVQKFTMVLSTVIGFTLYNYASGLSLYAITASTITVLEQTVIRKLWPPPTYRPLAATVS